MKVPKPQRKQHKHKDKITREIFLIFLFLLQIQTLGLSSFHLTLHAKKLMKAFHKNIVGFSCIVKYMIIQITFIVILNLTWLLFLIFLTISHNGIVKTSYYPTEYFKTIPLCGSTLLNNGYSQFHKCLYNKQLYIYSRSCRVLNKKQTTSTKILLL